MRVSRWTWLLALAACSGGGDQRSDAPAGSGAATDGAAGAAGDADPAGAGGAGAGGAAGAAGAAGTVACGLAGCGQTVPVDRDRVDILFVVDSSQSMREEQAALASEFPRLLRKLTSGDHDEDGTAEQEQVRDLHLAVVSTDLGVVSGAGPIQYCPGAGDDGILSRSGTGDGCADEYPAFLSYQAGVTDPVALGSDFACIATLGTLGCGYEQPLEAALKALWPSADPTIAFVAADDEHALGRGDRENAGFLRNGRDGELAATLAIVLVTDEDDCSVWDPSIWTPPEYLPPEDPKRMQPINLRCFHNPDKHYALERYLHGYRALHAHTDARVVFAAIAGVPVDLVDGNATAQVDFADSAQREAFYQRILDDPRMIEQIDPNSGTPPDDLERACESEFGVAYPARRIVELARRFGPDGLVQSICGDNFGPPIDLVVKRVVRGPD